MYRVRNVIKVTPDGWNATIEGIARLNEIAEKRGWQQATVWTQTFGPFGELSMEFEYPDLATYERESAAFFNDEEALKVLGGTLQYRRADDPGFNDIWERAETVDV